MDGFLEKNRDTILEEQINLFKASQVSALSPAYSEFGNNEHLTVVFRCVGIIDCNAALFYSLLTGPNAVRA